jgi:sugar phosphate isomerase/epimerase
MNLGIIQGRLSPPTEGFQECPDNWKREFALLPDAKLNHIEWIITNKSFSSNPFFYEDLTSYPISAVCADNLVNENIKHMRFLEHNLKPICDAAIRNQVKCITIPLLEKSSMENDQIREEFCKNIAKITDQYRELLFSFETELDKNKLCDIIYISDNYRVTYDTGNITSCRIEHQQYINSLHNRINNVHLKDRTYDAETVYPMSGDTDFVQIFKCLKSHGYKGPYSLQTARGNNGDETTTIQRHANLLKEVYNES